MANKLWSQVWKGEYNGSTQYYVGDFVLYQGSCYTCIQNSLGNLPTDTSYWKLVAEKGDTGATGPQGPQGPQGEKGLNWRGEWSSSTAYSVDDAVQYQGSSYICIQANTGELPTNPSYWELLAQKGQDGQGAGDVSGPSSSTNNAVVLFDGTTGKLIKDSGKLLPSGDVVGTTDTQSLSNKKISPRQNSQTSVSSITPDKASYDEYYLTALADNLTINNATSPSVGDIFIIYITDNGTSRTLTFGNHYVGIGGDLPTATTANKTMEIIIKYVTTSKAVVSYSEEQ